LQPEGSADPLLLALLAGRELHDGRRRTTIKANVRIVAAPIETFAA